MKSKSKKPRTHVPTAKKAAAPASLMEQVAAAVDAFDLPDHDRMKVNALIGRGRRTRVPRRSDPAVNVVARQRLAEAIESRMASHGDQLLVQVQVIAQVGISSSQHPAVSRKAVMDQTIGALPPGSAIVTFCPFNIVAGSGEDGGRIAVVGRALALWPEGEYKDRKARVLSWRALQNELGLPPSKVLKATKGVAAAVAWFMDDPNIAWRIKVGDDGGMRTVKAPLAPEQALRSAEIYANTPFACALRGVGEGTGIVKGVRAKVEMFNKSRSDNELLAADPDPYVTFAMLLRQHGHPEHLPMRLDDMVNVSEKRTGRRKPKITRPGFPPRPGSKKKRTARNRPAA